MKSKITCILAFIFVLAACQEEKLEVYHGSNYVYFTYMDNKKPQFIKFNFATDAPLSLEGKVEVKMTLLGYLLTEDAACSVSVVADQTTATPNNYRPITPGVFHKNKVEDIYEVTLLRDEALLNTDFTLTLNLDHVEGCLIGPSEYKTVNIHVTDRVTMPKWWNQSAASNLGEYSDMKYRVFIIFMDGEILDSLDGYTGIEFTALIADFKRWWQAEWEKGNYHYYDADGTTPLYQTIIDRP